MSTDTNLHVVFSPTGERFEVTRPNYLDLTRHAGWTDAPPHPDTVAAHLAGLSGTAPKADPQAETAAAEAAVAETARLATEAKERDEANEALRLEAARTAAEEAEDREAAGEDDQQDEEQEEETNARVLKTLPSEFADMDKTLVFSYLEATFPGNAIDGRAGRDKLVAFAIELANAELNG